MVDLRYRVYQIFYWNFVKLPRWLFLCHLWPLLMWSTNFGADWSLAEIRMSNPNHHGQVNLSKSLIHNVKKLIFNFFSWEAKSVLFWTLFGCLKSVLWNVRKYERFLETYHKKPKASLLSLKPAVFWSQSYKRNLVLKNFTFIECV